MLSWYIVSVCTCWQLVLLRDLCLLGISCLLGMCFSSILFEGGFCSWRLLWRMFHRLSDLFMTFWESLLAWLLMVLWLCYFGYWVLKSELVFKDTLVAILYCPMPGDDTPKYYISFRYDVLSTVLLFLIFSIVF